MSLLAKDRFRHFIAINHHGFHDPLLVEAAVNSASLAANLLKDPALRDVRVVLFYDPKGLLPDHLLEQFRDLGVETTEIRFGSNGNGLNDQMEIARQDGADFFYRVDADDTVSRDRFRLQARILENDEADICGGGLTYVNVDTQETFDLIPAKIPEALDYLTNCAMLHPTLAFRLDRLQAAGIAYWNNRLEDKQLGLQIRKSGLRMRNDRLIYGMYNLVPAARKSTYIAWLNLRLNCAYLMTARRFDLLPMAIGLFLASCLVPSHSLRKLRQRLRRSSNRPARTDAGFAGGSDRAKTAQPPQG